MGSVYGPHFARKAMWLYPKIVGFNPSERWGHSASYSHGLLYVYGGCCGGLHFRETMVLNLETMCWSTVATKGKGPGPRDSHTAALWGRKMVVFGGTNGSNKVNNVHILDLDSKEWTEPLCTGDPPSPRESHTATLVGDHKLVIFGGSGEGLGNYLNDLYVLDLITMSWITPVVKGEIPSSRDSHTCVAVHNKLYLFGGDSGDRYHGQVYVFDVDTLTWSKLHVRGSSPGARAGHASLSIGVKIYAVGGVGDKKYYNDTWCLDTETSTWSKLDVCGQAPQGRFSHTAIVADNDIAIYGGCGEDERPLRELLVLQLGNEHPDGRYNVSLCKNIRRRSIQEKKRTMLLGVGIEADKKDAVQEQLLHPKRRRTNTANSKTWEVEYEPEEHSLSLSQHSSPSQSDQEQNPVVVKPPTLRTLPFWNHTKLGRHHVNIPTTEKSERLVQERPFQTPIGAEVQGRVDGAFDSGYLMTAVVNGRVFRGVLFAPVPSILYRRGGGMQNEMPSNPMPSSDSRASMTMQHQQAMSGSVLEVRGRDRGMPNPSTLNKCRSDLDGVVLTLGGSTG